MLKIGDIIKLILGGWDADMLIAIVVWEIGILLGPWKGQ